MAGWRPTPVLREDLLEPLVPGSRRRPHATRAIRRCGSARSLHPLGASRHSLGRAHRGDAARVRNCGIDPLRPPVTRHHTSPGGSMRDAARRTGRRHALREVLVVLGAKGEP